MSETRIQRIAEAVLRTEFVVQRPEEDADKLNKIHYEVQKLVDRVGRNESLESFVNRTDNEKEMRLEIGLSDHEAIDAIVEEILKTAKKLVDKNEFEMEVE